MNYFQHIISDLFSIANGFASFAIKQTCIVLRIAKLKHREGVVFEFDWYFETALQARSHAGEFGGSSPLNFFCTPQILLRSEKFVLNIVKAKVFTP